MKPNGLSGNYRTPLNKHSAKIVIKAAFLIVILGYCLSLTSCGQGNKNVIDRITLSPGQTKDYSFETTEPMWIGILLNHDVSGGIVELKQPGSVNTAGTGSLGVSRQWYPKMNKIELKLVNNSVTQVEVTIYKGEQTRDSLLQK